MKRRFLTLILAALLSVAMAQTIPLGVLLPLTGGGAAEGPYMRNAAEMAFEEIHAMLERSGNPLKFNLIVEDTKTTPEGGLSAIESVSNGGAKMVIGPWSSGASSGARAYANANEILILSPSSTSPALAIPDDYLYRLVTPDTLQGNAAGQLLAEEGIEEVLIFHRGDSYGLGLAEPLRDSFASHGGTATLLAYDPDLADFAAEVSTLAREARRLGENSAIMLISFQPDGLNILGHARLDPTLSDVRWFGSKDALSPTFFPPDAPEEVSQFMVDVGMMGFFPTPPDNPIRRQFEADYQEKFGHSPSPWALYMYDAAWIAALTIMTAGDYDGPSLVAALPDIAAHYIGASGHKLLNEDGDSAVGVYDMMIARSVDGVLMPVTIGVWDSGSGVITRFE